MIATYDEASYNILVALSELKRRMLLSTLEGTSSSYAVLGPEL